MVTGAPAVAAADADTPQRKVERLASLADYVAADYPGAVKDGRILSPTEYEEQLSLIVEGGALGAELKPLAGHQAAPALLAAELKRLRDDVAARAAEAVVAADCRGVHRRLIDDYGLVLTPVAAPSLERAQALYPMACATCHGADGRGDTEQARKLKPPPASFLDAERMSRISPALGYHALTFGVQNTGMASFDTLPASDRWSLAFYVVGLRHQAVDLKRGAALFREKQPPLAATASRLAELSDQQLEELLAPVLPVAADREAVIGYLRRAAAFAAEPGGEFAKARRLLGELAAALPDRARARELAIAAYLDGVEPHEAALRARDRTLTDRLERTFFELRRTLDRGGDDEAVRRDLARVTLALDSAEERGRGGTGVPFLAALTIALREGFEASLLIAALLAFVRRSGRGDQARWVHTGWLAAVPAGLGTWFAVGAAIGGAGRELAEGLLSLVAAGMLLLVSNLVLGRLESRRWLKFLERRTTAAARSGASAGRLSWPLVVVAFIAAYREAIEIVLFFRALILDSAGHGAAVALGAGAGLLLLVLAVVAMGRLGRRLNPRPVMLVSGIVLTVLAVSLVGHGVRSLQEGGYVAVSPLRLPGLPSLGLYPTLEGLALQAMVLVLALLPLLLERWRAPKLVAHSR